MSDTLAKDKAVRGVAWNLIERFGIQGIRLILGIVLARLLSPEEFGIMGIITVFFIVAQVFIDSGFGQAYVQKKEVSEADANTVFYSNLIISALIYVIVWFTAPLLANFYEEQILQTLFRVMGFVMIINAFSVIQIAQITRAVNFKRKSLVTLISVIVSGTLGVIAAWQGMGVWSLVIQNLSERLLITLGLWITSKWHPALTFSRSSFRDMFKFGSWILFSGLLNQLFENIYVLVIGKLFPLAQLGYYSQAKKFQRLSTNQIVGAIGTVTFPIFAKSKSNIPRLQNQIKKFLQQTLIFIIPLLATFIVIAKPFVLILLTDKWEPMIPYLRLLCVVGMLYPINVVNTRALLAIGKSRLNFNVSLIKNSLRIINIFVTSNFGVTYIILGEIIITAISVIINTTIIKKYINYGFMQQLRDIWKFYFSIAVSLAIGYVLVLTISNLWILLISGILLVPGSYILLQYLINKPVLMESIKLKDMLLKRSK